MSADAAPRAYLALLADRPADADAVADVRDERGHALGVLAAWTGHERPRADAVRIDPRAIDPGGEAMLCSLVLAPAEVSVDFDDPAVVGATRAALLLPPADLISTFVRRGHRFAGAITGVRHAARRWRLDADPFARIFPGRIVRIGPGLLARVPAPTGPGTQRYGSGDPWPYDAFPRGKGID